MDTWYSVMVAEGDARSVQIAGDAKAFLGDEPCDGAVLQPLVPGQARSLVQCVPPLVDDESRAPFSPDEVTAEALTAVLARSDVDLSGAVFVWRSPETGQLLLQCVVDGEPLAFDLATGDRVS